MLYKIRTTASKERMKQMNTYGFTKKIALVGTGFVGMSFAYAMLCESVCDELVLIDVNKQKIGRASCRERV